MIFNPSNNKFVHFGGLGYLDFTQYVQLYDIKLLMNIELDI